MSEYESDCDYEYDDDDEYEYEDRVGSDDDGDSYVMDEDESYEGSMISETDLATRNRKIRKRKLPVTNVAEQIPDKDGNVISMLPSNEFLPAMRGRAKETADCLGVSLDVSIILLHEYGWSHEKLLEEYYSSDPEAIQRKCGVYHHCHPSNSTNNKKNRKTSAECPICYDDHKRENMMCLPCGHNFCDDCSIAYCTNAIECGGPSCVRTMVCPEASCGEAMTDQDVKAVFDSSKDPLSPLITKYESFQLRSFVDAYELTRWCPGNGCEKVACASNTFALEKAGGVATCNDCNVSFCIPCGEQESHRPCSCTLLSNWKEKEVSDSMSADWLIVNTKQCPKCKRRIEKDGGCAHMKCHGCQYHFCWLCLGDWDKIGGYKHKCNVYRPESEEALANAVKEDGYDEAKIELKVYAHYSSRYNNHSEGQNFASKKVKEIMGKEDDLVKLGDGQLTDSVFLRVANQQLVECRRVLKYSYAFGYFVFGKSNKSVQKERFEHHQAMLESFTEQLSARTEQKVEDINRSDVVNLTRVVANFVTNIVDYVEGGMDDSVV